MKPTLTWGLLLWFGMVLENSQPLMFPSCSLMIPLCAGCLFWCSSRSAIIITGTAMILRWLLEPVSVPLAGPAVLVCGMLLMPACQPRNHRSQSPTGLGRQAWWLCPVLTVLTAAVSHTVAVNELSLAPNVIFPALMSRLTAAGPCLAVIVLLMRTADELGLRRGTHMMRTG